jgi:hypothetical protein
VQDHWDNLKKVLLKQETILIQELGKQEEGGSANG